MSFRLVARLSAFFSITALAAAVSAAGAFAASVPNQVLVEFHESTPGSVFTDLARFQVDRDLSTLGAVQLVKSVRPGMHVLRFSSNMTPQQAAELIQHDESVRFAQPDYLLHLLDEGTPGFSEDLGEGRIPAIVGVGEVLGEYLNSFQNLQASLLVDPPVREAPTMPNPPVTDPRIGELWGLPKIHAAEAWGIHQANAEIVVADIDTGVDYNHEDLAGNMWRNPKPTQNDAVGYDFANNDPFPFDDQGHGTHTSGTIAAVRGNGKGIAGVAPNAKIMAIKFITVSGSGTTSDAIRSIDYAVANGARVMSNSWGGYPDSEDDQAENQALYEAVKRAGDANILFVAASGNDNNDNDKRPIHPGGFDLPNVLTVASTNDSDRKSFFSNYGATTVDVAAPGGGILSTIPDNKYTTYVGSSMACPHVAGLAALILAERPNLTAVEVKEIIMSTVDRLGALEGKILTGGRVNAEAALRKAKTFGF